MILKFRDGTVPEFEEGGAVYVLASYFDNGKAKRAIADEDGKNIKASYVLKTEIPEIIQSITELIAGKLDSIPTGAHNRPIYIKPKDNDETHGEAAEVDGIDVPGDITSGRNIQAAGGVAAGGIANLNTNGMGGGCQGTVTAVGVDNNLVLEPVDGVIDLSIAITQGMSQYVPGRSYERGESFYVIGSSGRRTAYRVVANMTEFNYGCLEQLTLKAVSEPLNIGTSYIQGLN